MEEKKKKRIIILTIISLILLILIVTFSYAYWQRNFDQSAKNLTTYDCFNISLSTTEKVEMVNAYPQTDLDGFTNDPYTVTIKNTCKTLAKYSIILNKENSKDVIDSTHIKIGVDDNAKNLDQFPTTTNQEFTDFDVQEARIIKSDYLEGNSEVEVAIRSWVALDTTNQEGIGKTFNYKIKVDVATPNGDLLAEKILENSGLQTVQPDFNYGSPKCTEVDSNLYECIKNESNGDGIFKAPDNDGTAYYFRGNVSNNNVLFAGKNWKILRINGDGSVRLILNNTSGKSSDDTASYNGKYTTNNSHNCTRNAPCESDYKDGKFTKNYGDASSDSALKTKLENWYKTNLATYDQYITLATYCNDTSIIDSSGNYGGYGRFINHNYQLTCPDPTNYGSTETHNYGGVYRLKIGTISVDELALAGLGTGERMDATIYSNFLYSITFDELNWYYSITMSSINSTYSYGGAKGYITDEVSSGFIMPVINLKADVTFTGSGTTNDPYVVEEN